MDQSKNAIDEVNRAMGLYQKILKDVPWTTLKQKLDNLESYRNDYSSSAASIIAEIRGHMTKGIDAYKSSSRNIYDWCMFAQKRLESYVKLFEGANEESIEKQKDILVELLDEGVTKMESAQDELGKSSSRYFSNHIYKLEIYI